MGARGSGGSRRGRPIALRGLWVALVVALATAVLSSAAGATGGVTSSGPDAPVTCTTTTPIAFAGRSITGLIATAGADACFTFSAAGGDVVWFDLANPADNLPELSFDFFSPTGVSTCAGSFTGASACDVPGGGTGTWTLQVSDQTGEDTGTFFTSIQRLDGGVGCRSIAVGKLKKARVDGYASSTCFKVPIKVGDYFFARAAGLAKYLSPSIVMAYPDGSQACGGTDTDYGCTLTQAGTATLLVFSSTVPGKLALYLQKMTAPQRCPLAAVGGGGHVNLAKPGDVGCFTFDGTSGEDVQTTLTRARRARGRRNFSPASPGRRNTAVAAGTARAVGAPWTRRAGGRSSSGTSTTMTAVRTSWV